ncbi:hypothetical protein [Nocardia pseudobrasiliensis]|uniref:Uncharacterized protein n=1 Tax=Nocardia pseudobrasiliensis TaxID=45979 RepID=A0A370HS20_9NOCA|nr:hypothetical protein [Nocardia pseudobrasiliensis]RDI61342.1 hypothetical protein DFR76_11467 [Nocardia pseudobrasiliensis]
MSFRSSPDREYHWATATWGVAGWFALQTLVFGIAKAVIHADPDGAVLGGILLATAVGIVGAAALRWRASPRTRGLATAAIVTAALWLAASVVVALVYVATE